MPHSDPETTDAAADRSLPSARRPARARNRADTERAILAAARRVLATQGFQAFGVNVVAREAGCDKQLVYRYFGGTERLIDAIGAELATWMRDRLGPPDAAPRPATWQALVERVALGYFAALSEDRLVQKIAAWESATSEPAARRLARIRSTDMMRWLVAARGPLDPPAGIDAHAANSVILAAAQHLAVSAGSAREIAGLPLGSEADRARATAALRSVIAAIYPAA